MAAPASSSRMVGRESELATLLDLIDEGRSGRPRTAIVRGEAGIGKTRLVRELLAAARATADADPPLVVAVGPCVDLGPIGTPFGPVRRVLRDLADEVGLDALRAAAGSSAAAANLACLLPELGDAETEVRAGELAEAIEVLLENLSTDRHVVIVIEDLQWADAATLGLLKTFATTLRGRHLTIVATYRSDDIDRFHPLRPVLSELDRSRAVVRVEVAPLTPGEVAEQVSALAGDGRRRVPRTDELAARSGGIPFLVEELVDLEGPELPETLRDLVLARYTRLSAPAQEMIRVMAAGGLNLDHDMLAGVSTLDEAGLDAALREAIDARVLVAAGTGYGFRHALTQEAVYAEILPSERVRVHRRYAERLHDAGFGAPDDVAALAEHWLAARDLPAAFDATAVALAQARRGFAPAMAATLAERLTELWDQVPDAGPRAGETLPGLHLAAAEAWHDLGESHRALRAAEEGLAADPEDPLTRAALLRMRFVQSFNAEGRNRREDLDAAIAILEASQAAEATTLQSRTLSNLALLERGEAAARDTAQAIALAEQAGNDPALAVALTAEAWRLADENGLEEQALAPLERAVTLDVSPAMKSYVGEAYVDLLRRVGRFDEACLVGEQHRADAVRAGMERKSGTAFSFVLSRSHFAAGRPAEGLAHARRARRYADRGSRPSAARLFASHHHWNDESGIRDELLADERTSIDEILRKNPEKHSSWVVERGDTLLTATGTMDAGSPSAAEAQTTAAELAAIATGDHPGRVQRAAAVTLALLLRDSPSAQHAAALRTAAASWPSEGLAPLHAAVVIAGLADAEGASAGERVALWRAALETEPGRSLAVWHRHLAELRLATALLDAGDRTEAADLLARIDAEASIDGVARVARWARELSVTAGLAQHDVPATGDVIAGLTPRERQVLELVAEGLTNPQIGERLFISPKTASVHVSAILGKIGAANRAEAAALYAAAS
ncbi:helix-turn-helix transcriptional regulator [Microbacterium aoyamense]|nr:AAA family ATPase [Microbacterium aoyamense]